MAQASLLFIEIFCNIITLVFSQVLNIIQRLFRQPYNCPPERRKRTPYSQCEKKTFIDTVTKFNKFSKKDLKEKPLYVDFIDEDGDDFGGLTKEFFTELFNSAEGNVLQGPSERLSLLKDQKKYLSLIHI